MYLILLHILNKFHDSMIIFKGPTSIIAFGGKWNNYFFLLATVILPEAHLSVCKLLHQFYSSCNRADRVCHFKDYFWNQFYAIVTCTIFVMELSLRWIIDLKNNALLRAASVWYIRCSIKFVKFSMMATKILERNINRPVRITSLYHLLAFEFRFHLHWENRKVPFTNSIFIITYLFDTETI